jgi:hypothetical protein
MYYGMAQPLYGPSFVLIEVQLAALLRHSELAS